MTVQNNIRDVQTRELGTFPPNGMVADLCAASGIEDDATTAEEQVEKVASGMGGDMEWMDVYKITEMFHMGCPVEEIKESVVRGQQQHLFNREFEGWKRFAGENGVMISNMAVPAFKDAAKERGLVVFKWEAPAIVSGKRGGSLLKRRKAG